MRLYSYVVARDYGFAPNPFYSICTLATCKPIIRKMASVNDWIVGTGSGAKKRKRKDYLIYVMQVEQILTFDQYWNNPRYSCKKPNLHGSKKQAFGDNIYHFDKTSDSWCQANSHHSFPDGSPNPVNIKTDTKSQKVLISSNFAYWGGKGPKIPCQFRNHQGEDICAGRNHKVNFSDTLVCDFLEWFRSLNCKGYLGTPLDWYRTA
jgi:hypothetical protein